MFTGLTEGTGTVAGRRQSGPDAVLTVSPDFMWEEPLKEGESVSVSGVCLTVSKALPGGAFEAFASEETLSLTTLGGANKVNLERALRLKDRLGGHLVTGHCDAPAVLARKETRGRSVKMDFSFPPELTRFVCERGSVALDGVSLTVTALSRGRLSANLIPETLRLTTLSLLTPGARVNLETDILAKYAASLLAGSGRRDLSLQKLMEEGF